MPTTSTPFRFELQKFMQTAHSGPGFSLTPRPSGMARLDLHGTPVERAHAAGLAFRNILPNFLKKLIDNLLEDLAFEPAWLCQRLRRNPDFFIRTILPRLIGPIDRDCRQELKSYAKGANLPYPYPLLFLSIPDIEVIAGNWGCSTIALGPPRTSENWRIGRNLDYDTFGLMDICHLLTVHHPSSGSREIPVATLGWPGLWASFTGWNREGLTANNMVIYNAKKETQLRWQGATTRKVPNGWLYLKLLRECADVPQALKFLQKHRPASANNLILADSTNEPVVVELSPKRMEIRKASEGALFATNYFQSPTQYSSAEYCWRFAHLQQSLQNPPHQGATLPQMKKHLHAVNQGDITLHSVVYEPQAQKVHLAVGEPPSSNGPWETLDWNVWANS